MHSFLNINHACDPGSCPDSASRYVCCCLGRWSILLSHFPYWQEGAFLTPAAAVTLPSLHFPRNSFWHNSCDLLRIETQMTKLVWKHMPAHKRGSGWDLKQLRGKPSCVQGAAKGWQMLPFPPITAAGADPHHHHHHHHCHGTDSFQLLTHSFLTPLLEATHQGLENF